jgi:hypothetical protein
MTVRQVPGETDFSFRVTSSTLIKIDGKRVSLDRLDAARNRPATVRFLATRAGDFAVEIRVGD